MDVMTTLAVQKLGRLMLRINGRRPRPLPSQTGWKARAGRQAIRQLPSHILATRASAGLRQTISVRPKPALLSVAGRIRWTRLPRHRSSPLQPSLNRRHSCSSRSSVRHPRETRASSPTPALVVRCRAGLASSQGGQGDPINMPKIDLRQANAFAPDHVMRRSGFLPNGARGAGKPEFGRYGPGVRRPVLVQRSCACLRLGQLENRRSCQRTGGARFHAQGQRRGVFMGCLSLWTGP